VDKVLLAKMANFSNENPWYSLANYRSQTI